jgi:quinol monooxygenase YgiN
MAVGLRIKFVGMTQEQFDKLHEGVVAGGPPSGLIFHASGPIDEGWGVIDFWESRAAFDALMPHLQQAIEAAGIQLEEPPDIKEFAVYETMAA